MDYGALYSFGATRLFLKFTELLFQIKILKLKNLSQNFKLLSTHQKSDSQTCTF
jgi:hypothetical protein